MSPRFSIVIPTRNRAHYLRFALQSALEQRCDDYEIVVSNNHSADDTETVVREADGGRVRLVNPGRDLSMSHHWEFALQHARGEYVLVLCDDDAFTPQMLPTLDARLARGGDDILIWNACAYNHTDHPVAAERGMASIYPMTHRVYDLSPQRLLAHAFALGTAQYLPRMLNSCSRREMLDEARAAAGGLFWGTCPDFSSAVLQLAMARRVGYLDVPLAVWGSGRDSIGRASSDLSPPMKEHLMLSNHPLSLVPCTQADAPINHITESFLLARQRLTDRLGGHAISWDAYFRRLRTEIVLMGKRGVDVAPMVAELNAREGEWTGRKETDRGGGDALRGRVRVHDMVLRHLPPALQTQARTGCRRAGRYESIVAFARQCGALSKAFKPGLHARYVMSFHAQLLTQLRAEPVASGASPAGWRLP